ncbi:hypothetical protein [Kineosporia sp. NBRC 101731]|uniref:hypothetical protein n=1 Tax=Kineosporia sp. NBRC 101731 TaxID=3032199 RepID=UPI0024A08513|nr:hypothetical protein [Kineosporia sp. NBRC 101731]GLY27728.1 hypothetical protein Kisp02_10930 [Kineosporia sp. NBRC 101731]
MNPTDQRPEPGLPPELGLTPELAARLQRLAETQTRDSRPFPRLETSVRRDRITRYGGLALAGAAAAAVVAVQVLAGGAVDRADQGVPSRPTPTVIATRTTEPATLEEAGYPTATVGSLAGDKTWQAAVRERLAGEDDRVDADDVHVVAAGDIEDRARYAVLVYSGEKKGKTYWGRDIWLGDAGAPASRMTSTASSGLSVSPDEVPYEPLTLFDAPGDSYDVAKAVVIVSAPGADAPQIATARTFDVVGTTEKIDTTRRAVPSAGQGVWAGPVTEDEYRLFDARITVGGAETGGSSAAHAPGYDLVAVAAPGTDPDELEYLGGALGENRATSAQTPVWAGTAKAGKQGQAVATLLRSANGVYIAAFSERQPDDGDYNDNDAADEEFEAIQRGHQVTEADSDSAAMASVWIEHGETRRYLVIAPQNATQVRVGQVTAAVKNRMAVLDVSSPFTGEPEDPAVEPVVALAADGSVIAQQTPPRSQEDTFLSTVDVAGGNGRSVTP